MSTVQFETTSHPSVPTGSDSRRLRESETGFAHGDAYLRLVRRGGVGYAVRGFSRHCLSRLIDFPELPLRRRSRDIIKVGRSALLVRAELPCWGRMVPVAYKRVRRRTWLKRLTALTRVNRSLRAWRIGHALLERDINTPVPLVVIVPHRHKLLQDSYLATEWIEGSRNLYDYCRWIGQLDRVSAGRWSKLAAESLGRLLGRMHAQNITHRDLKEANLLLVARGEEVVAYVIDLDGAQVRRHVSVATRIKNLARLALSAEWLPIVSNSTKLRFLKTYLHAAGFPSGEWKRMWATLAERTSALEIRKRRQYRRTSR